MQNYIEYKKIFNTILNLPNIIIIFFIIYIFLDLKIRINKMEGNNKKIEVYQYIEKNLNNSRFTENILRIILPDKGDVIYLKNGRWKNLAGRITKYNTVSKTYNIKVTKKLNPNYKDLPRKKIKRNRNDFNVN